MNFKNMDTVLLQEKIDKAFDDKDLLKHDEFRKAVFDTIELLDSGNIRAAEYKEGVFILNTWVKKAVLLYFMLTEMKKIQAGDLEFYDRIPLKKNFSRSGIRVVPHALVRYGAYVAPGVVLMPSYINIGAYVDGGTMVDTWATVGSCAQIGKNVHLSGGVGIGGVLEPLQAAPVIIGDGAFIGSRSIVVEGVSIGKEAVLGANTVLTASTKIVDVSGDKEIIHKAHVPERSVVIPGTYPKKFKAGSYHVSCAFIIGKRKASTDLKTSLNHVLRDFSVEV
jgi:2,3,4,5-tetrahydropyridine-2,6-dicarboxylate N-succinyltransferase